MTPELLSLLRAVDTPTVCNAIEVAQGKRGFDGFTKGTMLSSNRGSPAILGYARTAKIAAKVPPDEPAETTRERRMAYYRHMSEGARPAIAVVEDADFPHSVGAFWGEINTNVHKAFGLSGALTNGVMRDLGDLPESFPVIAGSVGPSHAFAHVKSVGQGAEIFGLPIEDGALVHADRHGAVVIPNGLIEELHAAMEMLLRTEKLVLDAARAGSLSFEEFEAVWAAFETART